VTGGGPSRCRAFGPSRVPPHVPQAGLDSVHTWGGRLVTGTAVPQ
jgi:hypothetical protein